MIFGTGKKSVKLNRSTVRCHEDELYKQAFRVSGCLSCDAVLTGTTAVRTVICRFLVSITLTLCKPTHDTSLTKKI